MGASGDLAPLSHLALGLMGEGKMWSPKSGWADAKYVRPEEAGVSARKKFFFKGSEVSQDVFALCPSRDSHVLVCFHLCPGPGGPWTSANISEAQRGSGKRQPCCQIFEFPSDYAPCVLKFRD